MSPARLIRRRYEPLRTVGRGGQGEVFEAIDHLHSRRVALKVRDVTSGIERATLLREARVLFSLRPHPGTVLLREDFFVGDRYFLVADWIEGVNLHTLVRRRGAGLSLDERVGYLEQVADTLEHLHRHDPPVVHRDVKPANVIVDPSRRAVLVDFGIAESDSRASRKHGTPSFRAPEGTAGFPLTPAADVFSLAATAYYLLTGRVPEVGADTAESGLPEGQAARLAGAFAAALAFDPDRRPAGAKAVIDLLRPPTTPTNLSVPMTSFVGRRSALRHLKEQLREASVLTLTGPAGVGKSRLAVETASRLMTEYPDGVFIADLSATSDGELVGATVASAVGLRDDGAASIVDSLISHLVGQRVLLVLDNCEHLIADCAALVARLVVECGDIALVATSRQPLGLPHETVWPTAPLEVPDDMPVDDIKRLTETESVNLFVDRARTVRSGFAVTETNAGAIARICRRLDGLPLGIELAAARLDSHTPAYVLEGIASVTDDIGAQKTLGTAIAWSHELLSDAARALFRRASVFAGGFTLEAAKVVCAGDELGLRDVLDVLARLVSLSLLTVDDRGDVDVRYRMLESIRSYAADRLVHGKDDVWTKGAFKDWALDLAESSQAGLMSGNQRAWLDRLEAEHDNLRAVLGALLGEPHDDRAARMAGALNDFWYTRGYIREGQRWQRVAAERREPTEAVAKSLSGAAIMSEARGDVDGAAGLYERSLDVGRRVGSSARVIVALRGLGGIAIRRGDGAAARVWFEESLVLARETDSQFGMALAMMGLGNAALSQLDVDASRAYFEESLSLCRAVGHERAVASAVHNLGTVARLQRDYEAALVYIDESIAGARRLGSQPTVMQALVEKGLALWEQERFEESRAACAEALALATHLEDEVGIARASAGMGAAMAGLGEDAPARDQLTSAIGKLRAFNDSTHLAVALLALGRLGHGDAVAALEESRTIARATNFHVVTERCDAALSAMSDERGKEQLD